MFIGGACNPLWAAVGVTLLLLNSGTASERQRLAVYAPQASFVLPVSEIGGTTYVGIFELLEPLSAPELKVAGTQWKLRVPDSGNAGESIEADFQDGSAMAIVRGEKIPLSAPARHENGRLLLPLHKIGSVLKPLLQTDVVFHEASRRLFLGGSAQEATIELRRGEPSTLVLHFPAAVNPTIDREGNTLKLAFAKDPVVIAGESGPLNDKLFTSENYTESNGTATVTISGSAPLLATFADGGKIIVVSGATAPAPTAIANVAAPSIIPAPPGNTAAPATLAAKPENPPTALQAPSRASAAQPAAAPPFLVVIDPAHGGSDSGARLTPTMAEKDITLSLARRLRAELQTRHIAVDLLRDGDSNLSFDDRAQKTNLEHPALFISLHAEPGREVSVYTPALPVALSTTMDKKSFLPWQTAQQAFLAQSTALAPRIAQSIGQREIPTQIRPAFLEPLHSIAAPAVAVEVPANRRGLRVPEDQIAGAIAEAVVVWKADRGAAQ